MGAPFWLILACTGLNTFGAFFGPIAYLTDTQILPWVEGGAWLWAYIGGVNLACATICWEALLRRLGYIPERKTEEATA